MKQSELKSLIKECVEEIVLEEGLFDRIKSRATGLRKSAKYGLKAGLDGADTKVFGSHRDEWNASKNSTLAKNNYEIAKIERYKDLASKKLDKVANEIVDDLKKMGIAHKGFSEKQMKMFKGSLEKSLDHLVSTIPGKDAPVGW